MRRFLTLALLLLTLPAYAATSVPADVDGVTTSTTLSVVGQTGSYADLLNRPLSIRDFVELYGGVVVFRGDSAVCDTGNGGHAAAVSALAAAGIDSDHIMCQDFPASGAAGTTLPGGSVTASAGTLVIAASASQGLTGAAGTAAAGTLTVTAGESGDATAVLEGAALTVYAGDMVVAADGTVTLTGATVTASAGDVVASIATDATVTLEGAAGTAEAGTLVVDAGGGGGFSDDFNRSVSTYSSGTTYAEGAYVYSGSQTKEYRSLQGSNIGHAVTDAAWWVEKPLASDSYAIQFGKTRAGRIASNRVESPAGAFGARYTGTLAADQYVEVQVVTPLTDGAGCLARQATAADTGYHLEMYDVGGLYTIELYKQVSGAYTNIATVADLSAVSRYLRLEVSGTTLTAKYSTDGASWTTMNGQSYTDSSIASGSAGLYSNVNGGVLDNFQAGDL